MGFKEYFEQYTVGEMTFGMEIEGLVGGGYTKETLVDEFAELLKPFPITSANMKDDSSIEGGRCQYCDGDGYIDTYRGENGECTHCNGTGQLYETFEFVTPPMPCTPKNISLMLHFFSQSFEQELFHTNESCGLHVHIGLPDIFKSAEDRFWIICQIASNKHLLKLMNEMKSNGQTFDFVDNHYASDGFLVRLNEALIDGDYRRIQNQFNSEKYRLMRIHPRYNTIEWRGPRNFLNQQDRRLVKDFLFHQLLPVVKEFTKAQKKATILIENEEMSKQDFFSRIQTTDVDLKYVSSVRNREAKGDHRWHNEQDPKEIAKIVKAIPEIKSEKFAQSEIEAYMYDDNTVVINKGIFNGIHFDKRFKFDGNATVDNCVLENLEYVVFGTKTNRNNQFENCKISSFGHLNDSAMTNCDIRNAYINNCRCTGCSFKSVIFDITSKTYNSKSFDDCILLTADAKRHSVSSDEDVN